MLWLYLFLIVFFNGFEAGGYQASLYSIGQVYDLSVTSMGLFASVELFATMLAPLVLGSLADRSHKLKFLLVLLGIQIVFAFTLFASSVEPLFIGCIFFLGLTTSALQFISIAALMEAYPVSGKRKIGFMTSMYALGAFVAPLIVDRLLDDGFSWRLVFLALMVGSVIAFLGVFALRNYKAEEKGQSEDTDFVGGRFVITGVLLLCVVMCIYVGFENGFAFFVYTMFAEVLNSSSGKFAISLFWVVMIPSRVLVGLFSRHAKKILIAAIIAIPLITWLITMMTDARFVIALIIPLGFACGAIYPSVLSTLIAFSGNKKATATAMITTATGIGGVVFTALTGFMADRIGLQGSMLALSAFFILSLISVLILSRIHAD
ncbi:MFS transporter [Butyrivibrio sp. VCB2001]|uniref:MFS transporter n=1 Tax=Butyrivibrio sp. VCB2001 TaxID=1280667 RepID=UPI000400B21E|nr:MFS transporter [Butyrivibrio sp. VCB2001]